MGYRIGRGFDHFTVAELDRSDKDDFIRRWCAVTEPPDRQKTATTQLVSDIHSTDRIERLTGNPMLLTTMALVKRSVGKLPDRRADLYQQAVQVLLSWRPEVDKPIDHREAMPQLEYLAYAMTDRGVQRLTEDDIIALLGQMRLQHRSVHAIRRHTAADFIRLLERRTGLLEESGYVRQSGRLAPVFEFRHLTFQEYLAALALVDGRFPGRDRKESLADNVGRLAGRLGSGPGDAEPSVVDSWREPVRLCATICNDDDVDSLLNAILTPGSGETADAARARVVLAAECLEDEPHADDSTAELIIQRLVGELPSTSDRPRAVDATLELATSRWASLLLTHLVQELRSRGERAVPYLGKLCGEALCATAPADDDALVTWLSTQLTALAGPAEGALRAALAIGYTASERPTAPWSAVSGQAATSLVHLLAADDPLLAGAAAWTLAKLRSLPDEQAWHPTDEETALVLAAINQPGADAARVTTLATIAGFQRRTDSVEAVVAAAGDHDPLVRAAAAEALGQTDRDDAAAPLVSLLNDPEARVREQAAAALGELGSPRGVTALIELLKDPEADVRAAAAGALGQFGDLDVVEPLLAALNDDADVSGQAARALGRLGATRAVEPLLARLTESDSEYRWRVIDALGLLGDGRAVEPLLAAFERETDDFLRALVVLVLGQLGDQRAFAALLAALDGTNAQTRRMAAHALGQLGDASARDRLVAALGDPDQTVRTQAAYALAELRDARTREPLAAALSDSDATVRAAAAYALGELADAPAIELLVARIGDEDARVRRAVASALGDLGDTRALDPLIGMLRDPSPAIREAAARALGELDDGRACPPLVTALTDPVAIIREAAVDSLAELQDRICLPALRRRLADPDAWVRGSAAITLGELGDVRSLSRISDRLGTANRAERHRSGRGLAFLEDNRAAPHLVGLLDDPAPLVRESAAQVLRWLAPDLAIEPLLASLDDPNVDVRRAVVQTLAVMGDPRATLALLARIHRERAWQRPTVSRRG
jgi:HEAT repeat protein